MRGAPAFFSIEGCLFLGFRAITRPVLLEL